MEIGLNRSSSLQTPVQTLALAAAGILFGFGLSRVLFENFPLQLGFLNQWPATLALAALLGILFVLQARAWTRFLLRLQDQTSSAVQRAAIRADIATHIPLTLLLLAVVLAGVDPLRGLTLLGAALAGWWLLRAAQFVRSGQAAGSWPQFGLPAMIFIAFFWLYLQTIAPTVGRADTFEFQVNVLKLGVNHGSGYPLYMLIAKLFSWLPVGGTHAFRINLTSAFFGACSALIAYALIRLLNVSRAIAALAALALATSFGLWSRAVEAEVYTLNVFLVGLVLWLLFQISARENPKRDLNFESASALLNNLNKRADRTPIARWLGPALLPLYRHLVNIVRGSPTYLIPLLGLALGLSFANHLTTGLLTPAVLTCLALLTIAGPRLSWRVWLLAIGLFFGGLALYIYLPIRWPAVNGGELLTFEQFSGFLTGREAHGAIRPFAFLEDASRYEIIGRKVLEQFGWTGAGLGILGFMELALRRWRLAVVSGLAWLGYAYFGTAFYVPDPDFSSFLLPAHLVQLIWIAVGSQKVLDTFVKIIPASADIVRYTVFTTFAMLPLSNIWTNFSLVDKSDEWQAYELGHEILAQPLAENAAILADSEKIAPLYYIQTAEGQRTDLDIIVLPTEAAYRAELDYRLARRQPVYLGRYLPHLAGTYQLRSVGPLTKVRVQPEADIPDWLTPTNINFGEQIELSAFGYDTDMFLPGETVQVTLAWQTLMPPARNYLVKFRLIENTGNLAWEWAGRIPVGDMFPTAAWQPGQIVTDYHTLPLDYSLVPGEYTLQVGLFPAFSEAGLAVNDSSSNWAALSRIKVTAPGSEPEIAQPARMKIGTDLWLLGYDAPESVAPGSLFDLILYWIGGSEAEVAIDSVQDRITTLNIPGAKYPAGAVFTTRTSIKAPTDATELNVQVARPDQASQCGWLQLVSTACYIATIRLEGAAIAAGAVNFDNQILLQDSRIENEVASPGDIIVVTASWQGLRDMQDDFTMFLHLLGPGGLVQGQVDTWPVQGTLPTTQWRPGTPVVDRIEIYLPADAPTGDYQVQVGWYLLSTLERLPVINTSGALIDDKYLIGNMSVR